MGQAPVLDVGDRAEHSRQTPCPHGAEILEGEFMQ